MWAKGCEASDVRVRSTENTYRREDTPGPTAWRALYLPDSRLIECWVRAGEVGRNIQDGLKSLDEGLE